MMRRNTGRNIASIISGGVLEFCKALKNIGTSVQSVAEALKSMDDYIDMPHTFTPIPQSEARLLRVFQQAVIEHGIDSPQANDAGNALANFAFESALDEADPNNSSENSSRHSTQISSMIPVI